MIDQIISHYRIVAKLGGAGMGVVYKAEGVSLQRVVTLKFLPDDVAKDPNVLARFQREVFDSKRTRKIRIRGGERAREGNANRRLPHFSRTKAVLQS